MDHKKYGENRTPRVGDLLEGGIETQTVLDHPLMHDPKITELQKAQGFLNR